MKSKVFSFPRGYFKTTKKPTLSALMIVALLDACDRQHKGKRFGPRDIKGSFTFLISRGLIVRKEVTLHGHRQQLWQVTAEAIGMLRALGFAVPAGVEGYKAYSRN